jgi:hypothetical protein
VMIDVPATTSLSGDTHLLSARGRATAKLRTPRVLNENCRPPRERGPRDRAYHSSHVGCEGTCHACPGNRSRRRSALARLSALPVVAARSVDLGCTLG